MSQPLTPTCSPYPTLFRSIHAAMPDVTFGAVSLQLRALNAAGFVECRAESTRRIYRAPRDDRKSKRLNSSHLGTSYHVFCLKKKKRSAFLRRAGDYIRTSL